MSGAPGPAEEEGAERRGGPKSDEQRAHRPHELAGAASLVGEPASVPGSGVVAVAAAVASDSTTAVAPRGAATQLVTRWGSPRRVRWAWGVRAASTESATVSARVG